MMEDNEILILTNDEGRKCPCCGQSKPLTHYNRKGDGYQPYCRECQHGYAKQWSLRRWARRQVVLENYTLADIVEDFPKSDKGDRTQFIRLLENTLKKLKKIKENDKIQTGDRRS